MDKKDFIGRDFLTLMDYSPEEVAYLLDTAARLKKDLAGGEKRPLPGGKTVAMLFEKPSTRTRSSFHVACSHLGIDSFYMRPDEMQLRRGEPVKDTARVLDRNFDALVIRTFGQEIVDEYARWMEKPVINALTDLTHPCQGLADLLTIREKKGRLRGIKVAYAGDVYNVCHSLMIGGSMAGMNVYVARPLGYEPSPRVMDFVRRACKLSGAEVVVTDDFDAALHGADVVYGNTWHSMGGPELEKEQRIKDFGPYQINAAAMRKAKPDAIFMHCLPGYRGEDMVDEVIEGPRSVVWDQAENRMHTEKAVLHLLLASGKAEK